MCKFELLVTPFACLSASPCLSKTGEYHVLLLILFSLGLIFLFLCAWFILGKRNKRTIALALLFLLLFSACLIIGSELIQDCA